MRKVLYCFSGFSKFDTKKNYYSILGIHKTATQLEVKNQYHKLAKLYHPDINQDNLEKFKQINEAYEVLKDESIRKDYDQTQTQDGQYTKRSQYNQQYHYGYRRSESNKWQQNEQSYNFKYNHEDIYVRRQNGENPLKYGQVGLMVVIMTGIFAFMAVETLVSLLFKKSYIVQDEMGNSYELSEDEFEKLQKQHYFNQFNSQDMLIRMQKEARKQRYHRSNQVSQVTYD
ncbi:hypothetical protein pb186bvf_019682 [Paramecium bursaria]